MTVRCARCARLYDDTHRLTFCPHEKFQMSTLILIPGQPARIATTLEELADMTSGETR